MSPAFLKKGLKKSFKNTVSTGARKNLKGRRASTLSKINGIDEFDALQWENSEASKMYPLLKGGLFYRTNASGYQSILKSGSILPNYGIFDFTYPQSEHSYAFSKGYISLFDFCQPTYQECVLTHDSWLPFFFDQNPVTFILKLKNSEISSKLVPNNSAPRPGAYGYKVHIPFVEAWCPEPISANFIKSLYVSFFDKKTSAYHIIEIRSVDIFNFAKIKQHISKMFLIEI